jgi:hypothetical protein
MIVKDTAYYNFLNKYAEEHAACPECGELKHGTTLMAWPYDPEHPENYRDKNVCTCYNCKDKHFKYERNPKK